MMGNRAAEKEKKEKGIGAVVVVCVTILVATMICVIAGLELAGRDPGNVMYLISAVLIPTSVGLFNAYQNNKTNKAVETVKTQTNGRFTEVTENNKFLASEVTKRDDETLRRFIREELGKQE